MYHALEATIHQVNPLGLRHEDLRPCESRQLARLALEISLHLLLHLPLLLRDTLRPLAPPRIIVQEPRAPRIHPQDPEATFLQPGEATAHAEDEEAGASLLKGTCQDHLCHHLRPTVPQLLQLVHEPPCPVRPLPHQRKVGPSILLPVRLLSMLQRLVRLSRRVCWQPCRR